MTATVFQLVPPAAPAVADRPGSQAQTSGGAATAPTPAPAGALAPEVIAALEVLKRAFGTSVPIATGPTVRELWTKYSTAEKATLRSWKRTEVAGRRFAELWGDRRAASLTMEDVDGWRASERERITRRNRPPTPATRNRDLIVLRRLLNWGVDRRLLAYNPLSRLRLEKENNIRQTVLTDADVEKILAECNPRLRVIVTVLYDTGMRRAEVCRLRWDQIDPEGCCIRLAGTDTKNGHARRPHLTQRALAALLAMPRVGESPYVFAKRNGEPVGMRFVYDQYLMAVARAGVRGVNGEAVTMHSLRHAFCAKARKLHLPDRITMQQTGHLTRSAFDRYGGQADDEELASLISTMEAGKAGPR